jgi:hypothetical protein
MDELMDAAGARAARGMVVSGEFPAKTRVRIQLFECFPPRRGFEFNFSKVSRQIQNFLAKDEGSNSTFQNFPATGSWPRGRNMRRVVWLPAGLMVKRESTSRLLCVWEVGRVGR